MIQETCTYADAQFPNSKLVCRRPTISVGTGYQWTSVVQNYTAREDLVTHMHAPSDDTLQ